MENNFFLTESKLPDSLIASVMPVCSRVTEAIVITSAPFGTIDRTFSLASSLVCTTSAVMLFLASASIVFLIVTSSASLFQSDIDDLSGKIVGFFFLVFYFCFGLCVSYCVSVAGNCMADFVRYGVGKRSHVLFKEFVGDDYYVFAT